MTSDQPDLLGQPDPLPLSPANAAFDEFWKIKPARIGDNPKGDAHKAFLRVVAGGLSPDAILAAARQWADEMVKEKTVGTRFVKQAVVWLNGLGRETQYAAKDPVAKKGVDYGELDKVAEGHGYRWNGRKYERLPGHAGPDHTDRHALAPAPRSVKDHAPLFCSELLPWFRPLAERHEASDKQWSFYGPGPRGDDRGIWVPVHWFEQIRFHQEKTLQYGDLHTPAVEIPSTDFSEPFVSATPAPAPIDMDGPPLEAYEDALSVSEEDQDFGL